MSHPGTFHCSCICKYWRQSDTKDGKAWMVKTYLYIWGSLWKASQSLLFLSLLMYPGLSCWNENCSKALNKWGSNLTWNQGLWERKHHRIPSVPSSIAYITLKLLQKQMNGHLRSSTMLLRYLSTTDNPTCFWNGLWRSGMYCNYQKWTSTMCVEQKYLRYCSDITCCRTGLACIRWPKSIGRVVDWPAFIFSYSSTYVLTLPTSMSSLAVDAGSAANL